MVRGFLVGWAALGCCLPGGFAAAPPSPNGAPVAVDVALGKGGVLVGQVVDVQGAAISEAPVSLRLRDKELVAAKTSPDGYFAFKGLRGGVYQITTTEGHGVYRAWAAGTAPPAAERGALLVSGADVVRGQGPKPMKVFLANPLLIGAAVATAVAVPVAVHNARQDRDQPSSP